ncbi:MAG: anti-sigma factor [Tenacibaculum sp.]|nr:anti-sigma factor [Tenacibaculum sp.]
MDIKEYIASGILELYVAGSLSEKENDEVNEMLLKYPELISEVQKIEETIGVLTASVAPKDKNPSFKNLLIKMIQEKEEDSKVIPMKPSGKSWISYTGWAASIIVGSALILSQINSSSLSKELKATSVKKEQIQEKLKETTVNLETNETLLAAIRDKNIISIPLQGQKVSPDSYAKVYWNKTTEKIYVDVQGLPDPPKGKVYQLWSLKLEPLTPTSLGTLDNFTADANKIFSIANPNNSQAFGITLEPEGGSETPTLEQLYTIGVVDS